MVFSSPIFIFAFLPVLLGTYFVFPKGYRNWVLLVFSLYFYFYGERLFTIVLASSILLNYATVRVISRYPEWSKRSLAIGVTVNLLLLGFFKYSGFLLENLKNLGFKIPVPGAEHLDLNWVHLPIGISFFTFQAISMLVDVKNGKTKFNGHFSQLALFITLFPQLIAGPIVRYADIAQQIQSRQHRLSDFHQGLQRFIVGLGKKVILANSFGQVSDQIFSMDPGSTTTSVAWVGVICYSLQIYFDFSGYSDMAIGLCRMFGFSIKENFLYPYVSRSITEFWRRWHISLSTWFRDYLYIPLGGNRKGALRTYRNLFIVFTLCGLWHGASWNFLAWGMYHGSFLVLERFLRKYGGWRVPRVAGHVYTMLVVTLGWVIFRADNIEAAGSYYGTLFSVSQLNDSLVMAVDYLRADVLFFLGTGILGSIGFLPWLRDRLAGFLSGKSIRVRRKCLLFLHCSKGLAIFMILALCLIKIYAGFYDPFIYFRF